MRYDDNKILILNKKIKHRKFKADSSKVYINLMVVKVSEYQSDRSDERNMCPTAADEI